MKKKKSGIGQVERTGTWKFSLLKFSTLLLSNLNKKFKFNLDRRIFRESKLREARIELQFEKGSLGILQIKQKKRQPNLPNQPNECWTDFKEFFDLIKRVTIRPNLT